MLKLIREVPVRRAGLPPYRRHKSPTFSPASQRYQSNIASKGYQDSQQQQSFWSTGRTLLFSSFVGSLAYVYGVTDAGSRLSELLEKDRSPPQYGDKKDFEKVQDTWLGGLLNIAVNCFLGDCSTPEISRRRCG